MLNIKFDQLNYEIKSGVFNKKTKKILRDVCGEFRGRELSAVVGPSGSGKSSLLDILSGFTTKNVKGLITINGQPASNERFKKRSAYILQEQHFSSTLTVHEAMKFSINFKTGNSFNIAQQNEKIEIVLKALGLELYVNRFLENLSGGQQKRLSIALELVDDPLMLFLDEPTTGLDASSSTQCIQHLKKLAQEGKTVICTIHTPSARMLEMFDNIYALADGCCIYKGSNNNLVPFLAELDLVCPENYNPSDFLLEIANNDYELQNHRLTDKIENGTSNDYRKDPTALQEDLNLLESSNKHSSSFLMQFNQLMKRNFLNTRRNPTLMYIRLMVHILCGVSTGGIYWGIGNKAEQIINNFKCIFFTTSMISYASFYSLLVTFPLNVSTVRRECFNRWYSLSAYYLAECFIIDIPITIVSNLIFISIAYVMTNQPMDIDRVVMFTMVIMLTSFAAQGLGLIAGSIFNLKGSIILAAVIIVFQAVFAGIYVFQKDAHQFWHIFFELSFLKHATLAAELSILGFDRAKLECESMYCHYESPGKFLEMVGFEANLNKTMLTLFMFFIMYRVIAFALMSYRIRNK